MRFYILLKVTALLTLNGCYQKPDEQNPVEESKGILNTDTLVFDQALVDSVENMKVKPQDLVLPERGDTLLYHIRSSPDELEFYEQVLKVVELSDSTVWFNIQYETVMSKGSCEGVGMDLYSKLGLEVDEYGGISYLAKEYSLEEGAFYYALRIKVDDKSLARFVSASQIATDAIPLDWVMPRISNEAYRNTIKNNEG